VHYEHYITIALLSVESNKSHNHACIVIFDDLTIVWQLISIFWLTELCCNTIIHLLFQYFLLPTLCFKINNFSAYITLQGLDHDAYMNVYEVLKMSHELNSIHKKVEVRVCQGTSVYNGVSHIYKMLLLWSN